MNLIRSYAFVLGLVATPAFASDWVTMNRGNWGHSFGYMMVDTTSIVELGKSVRKFWTLFVPSVPNDRLGEGYAYRKVLHVINCDMHVAATTETVVTDGNGEEHISREVEPDHEILPDSEDEYLMRFVCGGQASEKLATRAANTRQFLGEQLQHTRDNLRQFGRR